MCARLQTRNDIAKELILLGILQGAHQAVLKSILSSSMNPLQAAFLNLK